MSVCLDAWAVLAWLDGDDPAHDEVAAVIDTRPVMSWINGVEVYYRVERDHGRRAADEVVKSLRASFDLELPTQSRMIEAGRIKAAMAIALGDCFAIATAAARRVPLYTGDPEILERGDLPCAVRDLRPSR